MWSFWQCKILKPRYSVTRNPAKAIIIGDLSVLRVESSKSLARSLHRVIRISSPL